VFHYYLFLEYPFTDLLAYKREALQQGKVEEKLEATYLIRVFSLCFALWHLEKNKVFFVNCFSFLCESEIWVYWGFGF
jgi:hypothetical protein